MVIKSDRMSSEGRPILSVCIAEHLWGSSRAQVLVTAKQIENYVR